MKFLILSAFILFSAGNLLSQESDSDYNVKLKTESTKVPNSTSLNQYPNPFCPVTDLRFKIKEKAFVNIKLYDSEMNYITTLVAEEMNPGEYEINWSASSLKSGVYHYELTAGNTSDKRKLVFVK